ncbi:TonB-dependent receptor [Chloroherpeton thalassium]|nr:TonB-dependent receptor [Chloroherpeton thalassium]
MSTGLSKPLRSGEISGKVLDSKTDEAMAGVTLVLEGTTLGTVTDAAGRYKIANVPAGEQTILARFIGYQTQKRTITIQENAKLVLNFYLTESAVTAAAIEVVATKERQAPEDPRTSLFRIEPKQTKVLAGGAEDVLRSLQAIPGVLAQNDFSSQLFVRGSGPDQNLMLMDDIEVFNPYRLYGTISMFNPETVSDISLITGGFPAKYGDRLSAVLDITNRDGTQEKAIAGKLNANITDANAIFEGRAPFGLEGSWLISSRRTYYDLIVGPILKDAGLVEGDVAFPNFWDFQTKLAVQVHPEHQLQLNAVIGRDNVDIVTSERDSEQPDSLNLGNTTKNDVFGAAWHYTPTPNALNKFVVSWYRNSGDSRFSGTFVDDAAYSEEELEEFEEQGIDPTLLAFQAVETESTFEFLKTSLRDEISIKSNRHLFEAGVGTDFLTTSIYFFVDASESAKAAYQALVQSGQAGSIPFDTIITQSVSYFRSNAYVQDRIEILKNKLFLQPGLRFDYYKLIDKAYLAPRFNFSYALDDITTIRGAWGMYYQSPGYEKLIDQDEFFDLSQGEEFIRTLSAERAIHYVLGVDRWLNDRWQLKLEGYYKHFDDLLVQKKEVSTIYEVSYTGGDWYDTASWSAPYAVTEERLSSIPVNGGTGHAYGFEILLEKRRTTKDDRLNGWISYAYAIANRSRDGLEMPFDYDQRHTINVVVDYKLNDWLDLGVRWRFGSGYPYTPPVGVTPRVVPLDENETVWAIQRDSFLGDRVIFDIDYGDESNQNSKRLPAYHRLDIRFTAHSHYSAGYLSFDWDFYLDIINAYNNQNVISYRYDIVENPNGGAPLLERETQSMLPIIPTLGICVWF